MEETKSSVAAAVVVVECEMDAVGGGANPKRAMMLKNQTLNPRGLS